MTDSLRWSARRIVGELATAELQQEIAATFWRAAEPQPRAAAGAHLAKAMNFRPEFFRKATADKKAEWLLRRSSLPELHEALEMALMLHHTTRRGEMMGAFLDQWGITHVNGTIEEEEYGTPTQQQVKDAVDALKGTYPLRDIVIYLATAGLLMGTAEQGWREATWPVVDELAPELGAA